MARHFPYVSMAILASLLSTGTAESRSRSHQDANSPIPIEIGSPTLAPFQHVRFCLRYPAECKSDSTESERIELDTVTLETLKRIDHDVNTSIAPTSKDYGSNLEDGWTIAPNVGDCNDYAVTKRHELLAAGLPAKALRLAVVKTPSGVGHLVLVIVTTKGDLVLDNLTGDIRHWQATPYQWLKIQSASDSKFWNEIKLPANPSVSQVDSTIRVANR